MGHPLLINQNFFVVKTYLPKPALVLFLVALFSGKVFAQEATVMIDDAQKYQKVTGFGGFVNSPQFAYGHMSESEIRRLWGPDSDMKYNIMRLYLPVGSEYWSQSLATAKLAQSLGIMVFASPWSMPAEWKTNNSTSGVVTVGGVEQVGRLKEEHYEDYAHYLNDFVVYLRNNGVELAGISIQNEPDYKVSYAGCLWTPEQIAGFVRDYGHLISCPIIAAEGVGITDNYARAFLDDEGALANLGIFGGHQYGVIENAHKEFRGRGKEVWMTEFLINWNANRSEDRDFIWSVDAFDFARAVNLAMLNDVNAWIHYASKRYYGMLGDGTNGTVNSEITKNGYLLSHFSHYTIGATRVKANWMDESNVLEGSAYLTEDGDAVVLHVINAGTEDYQLVADLPFFSDAVKVVTTTEHTNMETTLTNLTEATFRPRVLVPASSFTTLIFSKSGDRIPSTMSSEPLIFNRLDDMSLSDPDFGAGFMLSGQTAVFDHSSPLISVHTDASQGYVMLDDRYNKLVFSVEDISSTLSYTSANTTLHYINDDGLVRSHNYGTVEFNASGNFDWVLDISKNVLPEGCIGIIGISNGNWSSILTLQFGDVYFLKGNEKGHRFSGVYSSGDSYFASALEDMSYTFLDLSDVSDLPLETTWLQDRANTNMLVRAAADFDSEASNVIAGNVCDNLQLQGGSGSFYSLMPFTAASATFEGEWEGFEMLVLPFEALVPEDLRVYALDYDGDKVFGSTLEAGALIAAHTPVLVYGEGPVTFLGAGEVYLPKTLDPGLMVPVYVAQEAPVGAYVLKMRNGYLQLEEISSESAVQLLPFSAYFDFNGEEYRDVVPFVLDDGTRIDQMEFKDKSDGRIYDLLGRPVAYPRKGVLYIIDGEKVLYH